MGLSAGTRLGPYEILDPLGAGGMGEVYRARDTRLGRFVAVKILPDAVSQDARRVELFETEARALAALSHPNILGIHDFGQSDGRLYTVTELLQGESLRDRMAGEPLPWRKSVHLAASIADGLASAHAAGIVHRDLKPSNIFITSEELVKILDFGLAKSPDSVSEDAVTQTSPSAGAIPNDGEVVGTLSYMAPEQLRGLRVDGRADIFSLGCVLFEMLSGKRPFTRATRVDTLSAILHEEPNHLDLGASGIPRPLGAIVMRCLEKRPEDRFDTAHDLAIALRSIYSDQQPAVEPTHRKIRDPRWRRVAAMLTFAAALAGVALLLKSARPFARSALPERSWGIPRQITSAPGWEAEPAFSPDGTLVAYSSNSSGNADIWVVDPDGGEPLRLTDDPADDRRPTWFPDGRAIAFVSTRNGPPSVWKISRLGGSAHLLIDDADMPAISPDGTRVAFVRRGPGGLTRIWVAPLADLSQAARLSGDDGGEWDHRDPAWSPDGTLLCYAGFTDLWLIRVTGGKARRLTFDQKVERRPVFTRDGRAVIFSSARTSPVSIWRVSLDGGAPERVLPGTGTADHPSLSPDGARLVFSSAAKDSDVVVVDRTTGNLCRIASSRQDESPAIAPDGNAVAYSSNRLGTYDLWLEALEGGCTGKKPPRRLTAFKSGPVATPSFSPDGQWISFFRSFPGHRDIWTFPLRGGGARVLIQGGGDNVHPAYSPDATRLAFVSNRAGHEQIWIVPIRDGQPAGDPWRLTEGDVTDRLPVWSPDASRIAFARDDEIWVTEVRPASTARRITAGASAHHAAWEPGGRSLVVTGLFGTTALHARRVDVATAATETLKPALVLGDRDDGGWVTLSRDGRFLATEIFELKGNLWITSSSRDGR